MRSRLSVLAAVLATLSLPGQAGAQPAQGVVTVRDLSLALATEIAEAALAACRAKNFKVGVAVVDRGGHVLIAMRDDGTAHHVIELAERKAYTARIFRQTSRSSSTASSAIRARRASRTRRECWRRSAACRSRSATKRSAASA